MDAMSHLVIRASAGAGKTHVLSSHYLKLLRRGADPGVKATARMIRPQRVFFSATTNAPPTTTQRSCARWRWATLARQR